LTRTGNIVFIKGMNNKFNSHITAYHKNAIQARKLRYAKEYDNYNKARAEHEATLVAYKPKMLTVAKASWVY
jgi:hypothetical protein